MIIEKKHVRNRIVKGWAFMALSKEEVTAIKEFLSTGDTSVLPLRFQHSDYSIYEDSKKRK